MKKSLVYFCGKEERDIWSNPCLDAKYSALPFCDTSLSHSDRITDLLHRIPDDEKLGINRTSTPLSNYATEMPSVGVRYSQWWNEALHGVGVSPGVHFDKEASYATSFPQIISTSHSFNRTLFHELGKAIATEARAFSNAGHAGLTYWTPNLNIFRDPRWGRGQETTGEDPYLTAQYVTSYVPGLQRDDQEKDLLKVSACCKHYAAYSLENYEDVDRFHFDANVTAQDMSDTYYPAFEACISPDKGGASCVMCSYNSINGVPSCANPELLHKARDEWKFDGYITSDCGATESVYSTHGYVDTPEEAVSESLRAGMDMDCGRWFSLHLAEAVAAGTGGLTMAEVDGALRHLFSVHMRLGRFDPKSSFDAITLAAVNTPEHQQLAVEAAQQAMVLLKNTAPPAAVSGGSLLLPYSEDIPSVALVGPNAAATRTMLGNYHGHPPFIVSPLEAMNDLLPGKVHYARGCDIDSEDTDGFEEAARLVQESAAVVLVVGLDQSQEKEGHDRTHIALPGSQPAFIEAMLEAARSPVTLVVMAGGAVCLQAYKDDPRVGAIVFTGYPGQAGGTGLVSTLFGSFNPSGRLTQTFYSQHYMSEVSFFDMGFRAGESNPGRGYRFYNGSSVVYPFGAGMSYTTFEYAWEVEKVVEYGVNDDLVVYISVLVSNAGAMAGCETVLVYLTAPPNSVPGQPLRQLHEFAKVQLAPKQQETITFSLTEADFSLANGDGEMEVVHGSWTISIGDVEQVVLV